MLLGYAWTMISIVWMCVYMYCEKTKMRKKKEDSKKDLTKKKYNKNLKYMFASCYRRNSSVVVYAVVMVWNQIHLTNLSMSDLMNCDMQKKTLKWL